MKEISCHLFFHKRTSFYLASALTSAAMITERSNGLWNRMIVAGVKPLHLLLCHVIAGFTASIIQSIEVSIVFLLLLPTVTWNSMGLTLLLIVFNGFSGIVFGVLISVIFNKFSTALNMIQFFSFASSFLCGKVSIFIV